jgi:hypothetical protein
MGSGGVEAGSAGAEEEIGGGAARMAAAQPAASNPAARSLSDRFPKPDMALAFVSSTGTKDDGAG